MLSMTLSLVLAAAAAPEKGAADLAPPAPVEADGKPIDVEIGHAAPCVADVLGTGKPQLLVGQFGDGKVRLYPNTGDKSPRLGEFTYLQAGGADCKVPSG